MTSQRSTHRDDGGSLHRRDDVHGDHIWHQDHIPVFPQQEILPQHPLIPVHRHRALFLHQQAPSARPYRCRRRSGRQLLLPAGNLPLRIAVDLIKECHNYNRIINTPKTSQDNRIRFFAYLDDITIGSHKQMLPTLKFDGIYDESEYVLDNYVSITGNATQDLARSIAYWRSRKVITKRTTQTF